MDFEPIFYKNRLFLHRFITIGKVMTTENEIIQFLHYHSPASRQEISNAISRQASTSTTKRLLSKLTEDGYLETIGQGPATKYRLAPKALITTPIDIETYFTKEVDERIIQDSFNFDLIENILPQVEIFTAEEANHLNALHQEFVKNTDGMTETEYRKEMERLGIDLSWKSSQIEGNTYSLLETERLLRDSQTATGKTKEEAIMLLNHKTALNFILNEPDYLQTLSIRNIEDIHALLVKDLNVDKGIRRRRVGITGTNYRPLDNEFQIREALHSACQLINGKSSIFEKALLTLVLLSYIQAFADGNKRTARISSNAILIANGYCPISFRTVDSIDYKKAMLLFYEQNNICAFKDIFIDQYGFAVKNYF